MHDETGRTDPRNYVQGQQMAGPGLRNRPDALAPQPTIGSLLDQVDSLLMSADTIGNRLEMAADRLSGPQPPAPQPAVKGPSISGSGASIESVTTSGWATSRRASIGRSEKKETIMWKGMLLLFALGAGPTDQPIMTTGWPQTYSDLAACQKAVETKASELNRIYATAGEPGRWVAACVPVK